MEFVRSREVDAIKARLNHPVIDSDGHSIEYLPVVAEIPVADQSITLDTVPPTMSPCVRQRVYPSDGGSGHTRGSRSPRG